jgi:hypothetical protein
MWHWLLFTTLAAVGAWCFTCAGMALARAEQLAGVGEDFASVRFERHVSTLMLVGAICIAAAGLALS